MWLVLSIIRDLCDETVILRCKFILNTYGVCMYYHYLWDQNTSTSFGAWSIIKVSEDSNLKELEHYLSIDTNPVFHSNANTRCLKKQWRGKTMSVLSMWHTFIVWYELSALVLQDTLVFHCSSLFGLKIVNYTN